MDKLTWLGLFVYSLPFLTPVRQKRKERTRERSRIEKKSAGTFSSSRLRWQRNYWLARDMHRCSTQGWRTEKNYDWQPVWPYCWSWPSARETLTYLPSDTQSSTWFLPQNSSLVKIILMWCVWRNIWFPFGQCTEICFALETLHLCSFRLWFGGWTVHWSNGRSGRMDAKYLWLAVIFPET